MERRDHNGLRWHLRAELLRKHFGLSHPTLYTVSKVGSKHIVEDYMETVSTALYFAANDNASAEVGGLLCFCQFSPPELTSERLLFSCHTTQTADELVDKLAFFNETRHAFGRSALLLSGGASLGLYHLGTIRVRRPLLHHVTFVSHLCCFLSHTQALLEKGLMPRVISGASAGSIAAGLLGVKVCRPWFMTSLRDCLTLHVVTPSQTEDELIEWLDNEVGDLQFFGIRDASGATR